MTATTNVGAALRDLLRFHMGPHIWVPALFVLVALGAFAVLIHGTLPVYWEYRPGLVQTVVICWVVSTISAYAGGFLVGRLYASILK